MPSPTNRAFTPVFRRAMGRGQKWLAPLDSERALHRLDAIALDHVALPHVLIALERHAAFLAGDHLARVILEALELRELAFVDHDVVADQPHIGAALDLA